MSIYKKGFTLIEILVVITIIATLTAIGMVSYIQISKQSRDFKRKDDLQTLQKEFELFYQMNATYPNAVGADLCYEALKASITTARYPTDPSSQTAYAWHNCSAQAYCICTGLLEIAGKGNASDQQCAFEDGGDYYCIQNRQTLDEP